MANAKRYFKTPFAESGNKTEVPDVSVGGAVGYDTGFGPDYELPQGTVGRKRIERDMYNGVQHSITSNLKQWQESLYPTWIEDVGTGVPFSYPISMIVSHAGSNWISNESANEEEPGVGSKWSSYTPNSGSNADINNITIPFIFDTRALMESSVIEFPVGKILLTNRFLASASGGGASYEVVNGATIDSISSPNIAGAKHALMMVDDATVNIKQIGAVSGDDTVNAAPLITHAFRVMRAKKVIIEGHHYLLSALDMTNLATDTTGRLHLEGVAGGTADDDLSDKLIFKHNGTIGIDLAGTSRTIIQNLGITNAAGFSPLVGIYKQRSTINESCKRHVIRDVRMIMGETSSTLNAGYGYIGLYNANGEDNLYENFVCVADTPNFLTLGNELNKSSPFAGPYVPPDLLSYTVSNNRYVNSSFVSAQGNECFVLDGVTGLYVEGSYVNTRNLSRLVRCVGIHSRQLYFTNIHGEALGAMMTYEAVTSVGYAPMAFEFVGGQFIGTDANTGDRWDGMFEFNGDNLEIRGLKFDIPNRPGSKVISFIKWNGVAGDLSDVDLRFPSASDALNAVYDGYLVNGDVTAVNVRVNAGDIEARTIYNDAHSSPRMMRNLIINGRNNVAFSEFIDASNPMDISFVDDNGLVTPDDYFLHVSNVNGVNHINGYINLNATTALGSVFRIRFTDTFFPIRSPNAGYAFGRDLNGLFRREITASFTSTVSQLTMDMAVFRFADNNQAKIECTF